MSRTHGGRRTQEPPRCLAKGAICKHALCDPTGAKRTHNSAQEQQQLDGQGGVIASKDRIYEMKIKNIVVTDSPATTFHIQVKKPICITVFSQCRRPPLL